MKLNLEELATAGVGPAAVYTFIFVAIPEVYEPG
jgi:hypothetical protein